MNSKKVRLDAAKVDSDRYKWSSRGYLTHYNVDQHPVMLTFRLHDSLPKEFLIQLEDELKPIGTCNENVRRRQKIEESLDRGLGNCHLAIPEIARITEGAILFSDSTKYKLHAWTVMPNHVHVLLTPNKQESIASIVHSWKSYSANRANRLLGVTGPFWQREYFDRYIRNEEHFKNSINYIHNNPIKAGICDAPANWEFGSARLFISE